MSARVVVVANDHVGSSMAGPGIRALRFATELAKDHEVTLVVPFDSDVVDEHLTIVQDDPWDARRMNQRLRRFDVVISQKLPVMTMRRLAKSGIVAVYDLYAPVTIEALAQGRERSGSRRLHAAHKLNAVSQAATLSCGDAFICASERQRDLWLGALLALGRIDQSRYDADPSLRALIDVVPFGIDVAPPRSEGRVLKGVVPGIASDDKVLLWGGGIWDWFDPLTVIEAVADVARRRDDIRLYFMGLRHPNPGVPRMEREAQAVTLADRLGLRNRSVFFNDGWVPYDRRGAYYLEADIGVSAHFDDLETRFAFRTRLLDCFWAGLPVLTTAGDALADLVESRGLGKALPVGDVGAWAEAIETTLKDEGRRDEVERRVRVVQKELAWPCVVQPLRRLVSSATTSAESRLRPAMTGRYVQARLENALLQHGATGALAVAIKRALRRSAPLQERVRPPLT